MAPFHFVFAREKELAKEELGTTDCLRCNIYRPQLKIGFERYYNNQAITYCVV
jgi:hypothetical protein